MHELTPHLKKIKLVITDVDGVLTDGTLHYGANGEVELFKSFNVKDGLGIKLLQENGIEVAILSGRDSAPLRQRIKDLRIQHFQLGKLAKNTACLEIMQNVGVTPEETAFIGDDSVDLPAFATCGLSVAVADALSYVKSQADLCLCTAGGKGALREFADMLLLAQGKAESYQTAQGFLENVRKMCQ